MRIRNPSLWIAALSAGAVVGFVLSDIGQRPSPGPLADVHGREEGLAGKHDCSECHGGWRQTMTEACNVCHTAVQEDVDAGTGLHGVIGKERAAECARCHTEHHGAEFQIVNDRSFALADVPDVNAFDHQSIGFAMGGKHLEVACEKCHVHADEVVLPKGQQRYMGLDQQCGSCHDDPHKGQMAIGCADCHDQTDFKQISFADHDRYLPLNGSHGGVECRACHTYSTPHALEALGREPEPPPRACAACHDSPHDGEFMSGVAAQFAKPVEASCVECHRPDHQTFLESTLEITPEQHAKSRFELVPPHADVACEGCHSLKAWSFAERFPGRSQQDCGRCHADVHAGQFDVGPFAVRLCTECHEEMSFQPHTFTVEKHARTDFKLTGAHFEAKCNDCHKVLDEGSARAFHGTPQRCEGCHRDAHAGFFDKLARKELRNDAGTCAACHLTTTFTALPKKGFDHARWTAYPLLGAHAESDCESCHPRSGKPDGTGRTFGRVAERFGKLEGCATCHKDAHQGVFDGPGRPRQVGGRTGCARCHDESSFRTVSIEFDHARWTGYALEGAHESIGCSDCHAPLREPDDSGRTFARAKGRACADCHGDPHARQFEQAGRTDCQRCHRSATSFSDLFFKHNLHSRYRLDKTHARVACEGCHMPEQEEELEFVRYRPLGMECGDCHGAPQDALRKRKEKHE